MLITRIHIFYFLICRSQPPPSRVSSRHRTPKRLFGIEESVDPQQVSSDDDEEQEEVIFLLQ